MTNKNMYKRQKNFSGSFIDWFNQCVDEEDVFRVWFKGSGEDWDYLSIVNVIEVQGDYLLGLRPWKENPVEGHETIYWYKLSDISTFYLLADEESLS